MSDHVVGNQLTQIDQLRQMAGPAGVQIHSAQEGHVKPQAVFSHLLDDQLLIGTGGLCSCQQSPVAVDQFVRTGVAISAVARPSLGPSVDDIALLLKRARWYRRLASREDEQTRADRLYLAEQYEVLARDMERGGPQSSEQ